MHYLAENTGAVSEHRNNDQSARIDNLFWVLWFSSGTENLGSGEVSGASLWK